MTREGTTRDSYTGRGGQLAVVTELLMRGVNAAIPEVDEGEDTLAFVGNDPEIDRVQVKTATAVLLKTEGCYSARVSVPLASLQRRDDVPLIYVFAVRLGDAWSDFVIIPRRELLSQSRAEVGHLNRRASELQLYLSFSPTGLSCSERDWSGFRNAWATLPVLQRRSQEKTV